MTTMTNAATVVTGGVDTHGQTHHAAVLDEVGRELGDCEFPTTPSGYRSLLAWLRSHGQLGRVGVEGSGTYGAALSRHLYAAGVEVVEVDRPDRRARRAQGKSDPLDAYSAARAALSGRAAGSPRRGTAGLRRSGRCAWPAAARSRHWPCQTSNQLKALPFTAPAELREQLRGLSTTALVPTCARLRPAADVADPEQATKTALRRLARCHEFRPKRSATPTPSCTPWWLRPRHAWLSCQVSAARSPGNS